MVVRQANFGSCFCINQTNMQIHLMGGGAQGTGSDEKRFRGLRTFSICAKFSHAQKRAPQSPLSYELAAQAIYSWVSFSLTGVPH